MLLSIWKKEYPLRMFGKSKVVDGYFVTAGYKDVLVKVNVQQDSNSARPLAEGERAIKTIRVYSDFPIQTADAHQEYRGDRLFYDHEWYECTSSLWYEHLPTRHYVSTFVRVPEFDKFDAPPNVEVE